MRLLTAFQPSQSKPQTEKHLQARILQIILITILVGAGLALIVSLLWQFVTNVQILSVSIVLLLVALALSRRGYLQISGLLVLLTTLGSTFALRLFGFGSHDLTMTIYPIIIILASIFSRRLTYWLTVILTISSYGLIVYLETNGHLINEVSQYASFVDFLFMIIILFVTAVAMYLLVNTLWVYLQKTQEKEEALWQSNETLAAQKLSLQESQGNAVKFQEQLHLLHEIGIELSQISELDKLYFQSIKMGLQKLGFERLGLLLYDTKTNDMRGTFGTDEAGNIVDERDFCQQLPEESSLFDLLRTTKRIRFHDDATLFLKGEVVGRGWRATVTLWNGREGIGWLSADNLISKQPPRPHQLEVLALYGTTVGNLITRLRAKEAMRQSEAESRHFQKKLQELHDISLKLAAIDNVDDLYRQAVIYGRERLGFDRLGILLFDKERGEFVGTFGTDAEGNLRDERGFRQQIDKEELIDLIERKERLAFWQEVPLIDLGREVDTGWNALASLWNGDRGIGWLAVDNLVNKEPPSRIQFEILTLYGATLGHLLNVKSAEESLKKYAAELERSNQELQTFAFVSSHDLQEPLRKIQTFGDLLSDKYARTLDEKGLIYLERMRVAAARMQTLIQDLLIYSRVQTQGQAFVKVDLNQLLSGVLSDLELRIEEKQAEIVVEALPEIEADHSQMRQLFQNLISNSLKFSKAETKPFIKISLKKDEINLQNNACQIVVSDNGIGFDQRFADRIFVMFQRLHGQVDYEGSGLGLALCKRIVERHHGRIEVSSVPGEGTSFFIFLPLKQTVTVGFPLEAPQNS